MDIEIPEIIREQCKCLGGVDGLKGLLLTKGEASRKGRVLKAVADQTRLTILDIIIKQPLCVCIIKDLINMPDSQLSYHLNVLKKSRLIEGERHGSWIIYYPTERGRMLFEILKEI